MTPWTDRTGRFSPLKALVLAGTAAPALWLFWRWRSGALQPLPFDEATHFFGTWTIRFILLALLRRLLGIAAFAYAAMHFSLYVGDHKFDLLKVGSEIALRIYLTVGFLALLGLTALAATSTDGMVRRLGGAHWQRLHQVVYVLGLLVLIHFFQQTKADVWLPTFIAGLFGWLMGYRFLIWRKTGRGELPTWQLAALAVGVAVLTFLAEAIGIGIAFKVSPLRVLETAFDFDPYSIRPGWLVFAAALVMVGLDFVRARLAKPRRAAPPATARPRSEPA